MIQKFEIDGPLLIENKIFHDDRGFFTERFNKDQFKNIGIEEDFIQDNFSRSKFKVLRGMHLQLEPAQSKLVTCLRGHIQDIIVDLRKESKTFGKYISVELSHERPEWLYVPKFFAHGFCVLSEDGADVMYKVDGIYNPKGEISLKWNDSFLQLPWSIQTPMVSEKDKQALEFDDVKRRLNI